MVFAYCQAVSEKYCRKCLSELLAYPLLLDRMKYLHATESSLSAEIFSFKKSAIFPRGWLSRMPELYVSGFLFIYLVRHKSNISILGSST